VAQINVGAATEVEMKEKKARVEDALHACRAAVEEGILPGGGVAVLRARKALDRAAQEGVRRRAHRHRHHRPRPQSPRSSRSRRTAASTARSSRSKVEENTKANFGYNALTHEYGDLVEMGVIVPTKVERVALQNAASIAGLLLTTDAAIVEIKEKKGHTLNDILQALASSSFKLGGAALIDGFSSPDASAAERSMPVDLKDLPMLPFHRHGVDVGFIPLRPYYKQLLDANENLQFLDESVIIDNEASLQRPHMFFVLGAPNHWNQFSTEELTPRQVRVHSGIPIACVPVDRVDDEVENAPGESFWGVPEAFYGRVWNIETVEGHTLDDIRGMSGGPIFVVDDEERYHLVGIQSSWLAESRRIRASRSSLIPRLLDGIIDVLSGHDDVADGSTP
jgi:hypothetical protein